MTDSDKTTAPVSSQARKLKAVTKPRREVATHDDPHLVSIMPNLDEFEDPLPKKRLWASLILLVLMPCVVTAWYLLNHASDRFSSEFQLTVQSVENAHTPGIGSLLGLASNSGQSDRSRALVEYLKSRAVVEELQRNLTLRDLYSAPELDWFTRMSPAAPIEVFVEHWRRFTHARYDPSSNIVTVKVTAFSPDDVHTIGKSLVKHADTFVNQLSIKARKGAVDFAEREVAASELRLVEARSALAKLQQQQGMLDPVTEAEQTLNILASLRTKIAERRARLASQLATMNENAPPVQASRNIIFGLQTEQAELNMLLGHSDDTTNHPMSELLQIFRQARYEVEFAELTYASALTSLEAARVDASRKKVYLATINPPSLPQATSFPKPIKSTFLVFLSSSCLWLLGMIAMFTIRERI